MYSYTHRNGNLTVLVKRLMPQHHLPGESEGKIWMWTRCSRCDQEHGISKSTPRVLISAEARNLSFGKFLELSFSSHSAARRLSICGHLVNRDCLRFFGYGTQIYFAFTNDLNRSNFLIAFRLWHGIPKLSFFHFGDGYILFCTDFRLGSRVVMFRYSSVEIYTTCKPQPTLQFVNPIRQEWFEGQRRHVWLILFTILFINYLQLMYSGLIFMLHLSRFMLEV